MKRRNVFLGLVLLFLLVACNDKVEKDKEVANENKIISNKYREELQDGVWQTNVILGANLDTEICRLTKFKARKFAGNLTQFSKDSTFKSQYVAWCGNDNFTNVYGTYRLLNNNKIKILVDSVTYHGGWEKPTEYRKKSMAVYSISKDTIGILLKKIN